MAIRMQQRQGTADQWLTADPVLGAGEIGFETDTNSFKIGDGVNSWTLLDYFTNETGLAASLSDYILATEKASANGVATLDANGFVPATQLDIDLTAYYTSAEVDAEIAAIPAPDYTGLATETYADTAAATAAAAVVDAAPGTLDTLNELAAALGDDANFATTVSTSLGNKQDVVAGVSDTEIGYLDGVTSGIQNQLDNKVSSSSPAFSMLSVDSITPSGGSYVTAQDWGSDQIRIQIWNPAPQLPYLVNDTFYFTTSTTGSLNVDNVEMIVISNDDYGMGYNDVIVIPTNSADYANATSWAALSPTFSTNTITFNKAATSNVSSAEVGYLEGVTSSIQNQLDEKAPLSQAVSAKTSGYTLTAADRGGIITASGTFTISVPGYVFSEGDRVDIVNIGTGVITISGAGAGIYSKDSASTIDAQYAGATLLFGSSTEAYLIGAIA